MYAVVTYELPAETDIEEWWAFRKGLQTYPTEDGTISPLLASSCAVVGKTKEVVLVKVVYW